MPPASADLPGPDDDLRERLLDATLVTIAERGVAKATVSEVATLARSSRASVYRLFPGGREELLRALGSRELERCIEQVCQRAGTAAGGDVATGLARLLVEANRAVFEHGALHHVLVHEPDVLIRYLGFQQCDRLYRATSRIAAPYLAPLVGEDQAPWAAEWLTRLVISYVFFPPPDGGLDDPAVAGALARDFLLPGLTAPVTTPAETDDRGAALPSHLPALQRS